MEHLAGRDEEFPDSGERHDSYANPDLNPSGASFQYFGRLPPELRLMIWTMAFDDMDPAIAVCHSPDAVPSNSSAMIPTSVSTPTIPITITVVRQHGSGGDDCDDGGGGGGFGPSVPLARTEAWHEWLRQIYSGDEPARPAGGFYPPRTVFLTHTFVLTQCRLEGLAPFITHIAIAVVDGPNILRIFECLAALPQLKTIIIVISATLTDRRLGRWQEKLCKKLPGLLARLTPLVDRPSLDGEWHERSFVGWLLRNRLKEVEMRCFYRRDDSPCIKLLVHGREDNGRRVRADDADTNVDEDEEREMATDGDMAQPWSLVLY